MSLAFEKRILNPESEDCPQYNKWNSLFCVCLQCKEVDCEYKNKWQRISFEYGQEVDLLQPLPCQSCGKLSRPAFPFLRNGIIKFTLACGNDPVNSIEFLSSNLVDPVGDKLYCDALTISVEMLNEMDVRVLRLELNEGKTLAESTKEAAEEIQIVTSQIPDPQPCLAELKEDVKALNEHVQQVEMCLKRTEVQCIRTDQIVKQARSVMDTTAESLRVVSEISFEGELGDEKDQAADSPGISKPGAPIEVAVYQEIVFDAQEKLQIERNNIQMQKGQLQAQKEDHKEKLEETKTTRKRLDKSKKKLLLTKEKATALVSRAVSRVKAGIRDKITSLFGYRSMLQELKNRIHAKNSNIPPEIQSQLNDLLKDVGSRFEEAKDADEEAARTLEKMEKKCRALSESSVLVDRKLETLDSLLKDLDKLEALTVLSGEKLDQKQMDDSNAGQPWHAKYRAECIIGFGAFSVVYLVVQRKNGKKFALQDIDKQKMGEFPLFNRMKAKTFLHKALVKIEEVFETETSWFVVMEYCQAGNLAGHFYTLSRKNAGLTEREVADWVKRLALALQYLHNLGIAHLDLKPDNVLYDDHEKLVLLADFGLSREVLTGTLGWAGSLPYMSPEMKHNFENKSPEREWGLKTDMWSLGVTMLELLTGRVEISSSQKHTFSEDAQDLLKALLHPDPEKRPTASQVLSHSWFGRASHQIVRSPEALSTYFSFNNLAEIKVELLQRLKEVLALKRQGRIIEAEDIWKRLKTKAIAALGVIYNSMHDSLPIPPQGFIGLEWPIESVPKKTEPKQTVRQRSDLARASRLLSLASKSEALFQEDVQLGIPPNVKMCTNVKGLARTLTKAAENGVLGVLDPLRCSLACATWEDLAKVNANFSASPQFQVVRKKNDLFHPPFQLNMNVVYGKDKKLVCEVQVVLKTVYNLRKQTESHFFYEIERCEFKDVETQFGLEHPKEGPSCQEPPLPKEFRLAVMSTASKQAIASKKSSKPANNVSSAPPVFFHMKKPQPE